MRFRLPISVISKIENSSNSISKGRVCNINKIAQFNDFPVDFDLRSPPAIGLVQVNTLVTTGIIALFATVGTVKTNGGQPKVLYSIVALVLIYVVKDGGVGIGFVVKRPADSVGIIASARPFSYL